MWSSFNSLKSVLTKNIKQKGLAAKVEKTLILEEFQKIAAHIWDQDVVEEMKPVFIKNKILHVAVLNSVLGQEIILRKRLIINELLRKFGPGKVEDIRIDY